LPATVWNKVLLATVVISSARLLEHARCQWVVLSEFNDLHAGDGIEFIL
jgi:hypothetical protein